MSLTPEQMENWTRSAEASVRAYGPGAARDWAKRALVLLTALREAQGERQKLLDLMEQLQECRIEETKAAYLNGQQKMQEENKALKAGTVALMNPANKQRAQEAIDRMHCNCAETPPTMPTCRSEHLDSCPVSITKLKEENARLRAEITKFGKVEHAT